MKLRRKNFKIPVLIFLVLGLTAAIYILILKPDQTAAPGSSSAVNENQELNSASPETPKFPVIDLQPTVNAWAARQSGQASVVIIDLENNKTVAELNPDTEYFAASLYKLYVAYEGYLKIVDGTFSLNDPYLGSYTRSKCLDLMIRESYSPCGEKMMAELGPATLNAKLETYGIKNTSLSSISTTANDSAAILQRLYERRELTEDLTRLYLDSLLNQPALYRRGLPSGFASKLTVYDKVGWNGYVEWHDAAIVTLPSGRSYVITVLTKNIGTRGIIELAKAIEAKLL